MAVLVSLTFYNVSDEVAEDGSELESVTAAARCDNKTLDVRDMINQEVTIEGIAVNAKTGVNYLSVFDLREALRKPVTNKLFVSRTHTRPELVQCLVVNSFNLPARSMLSNFKTECILSLTSQINGKRRILRSRRNLLCKRFLDDRESIKAASSDTREENRELLHGVLLRVLDFEMEHRLSGRPHHVLHLRNEGRCRGASSYNHDGRADLEAVIGHYAFAN